MVAPSMGDSLIYSDILERQFNDLQVVPVSEDGNSNSFTTAGTLVELKSSSGNIGTKSVT